MNTHKKIYAMTVVAHIAANKIKILMCVLLVLQVVSSAAEETDISYDILDNLQYKKSTAPIKATVSENNTNAPFDKEANKIMAARDAGKITEAEASEELLALVKSFYPNDFAVQAAFEARLKLAQRLVNKEIDQDSFNKLWSERWNRFNEMNIARHAEAQRQWQSQQDAIQSQRDAEATAYAIRGIGNAFRNSTRPFGTNCTTRNVGGSLVTNCY